MKTFQGFNLILTDVPSSQIKMRETTEFERDDEKKNYVKMLQ